MKYKLLIAGLMSGLGLMAQFAPPAGQTGTTAMHKDSSAFQAWATSCTIERGKQDISDDTSHYASVGDTSSAIGPAGTNGIVSLGDSGIAILTFDVAVTDGPGFDFAVFENSFSDDFLEFAFVEVSSDGTNYFRFPAVSNIQDTLQTDPFGLSDATKVNNLAGKYRANYGTPFDLSDIPSAALLNPLNITHIKIIDVIGSIDTLYASYGVNGKKINDPFPTPFPSSGFDLDAVGVINSVPLKLTKKNNFEFSVYPNPSKDKLNLYFGNSIDEKTIRFMNISIGTIMLEIKSLNAIESIDISALPNGVYMLNISCHLYSGNQMIIIQH